MGFICFPTSGVEGVAALHEAFQGRGGQWGVCCRFTGLF